MNRELIRGPTSLLLLALAYGCANAGPEQDADTTARWEGEIIAGTQPADGSQQATGVVQVSSSGGGCSGTLLSNRLVLTARHCVRGYTGIWAAALNTAFVVRSDGPANVDQSITAEVVTEGNLPGIGADDFAILRLQTPVSINGPSDSLYNPIYTGTDASLVNQTVNCIGYGHNVLAQSPTPANPTGTNQNGFGFLRTASLGVADASSGTFRVVPNAAGQITTSGDSGSTCFFTNTTTGARFVTGVASFITGTGADLGVDPNNTVESYEYTAVADAYYASPGNFRQRVENQVFANVSVTPFTWAPAAPNSATTATFRSLKGVSAFSNVHLTTAVASGAVRGGWMEVVVNSEPAGYMCGISRTVAPMTGDATISGTCLGDGIVSNLLSVML